MGGDLQAQRAFFWSLEAYHEFEDDFVLFGFFGGAGAGIEVLFVVQAQIGAEGFAEAEGEAAGEALAAVVGGGEVAGVAVVGLGVALAGHHVVAKQEGDFLEGSAQGEVVVDEGIDGLHVFVGVVGVGLIEVFGFEVEAAELVVEAGVVAVHADGLGADALDAEGEVEAAAEEELGFGGVVDFGVPLLLIGEAGAVVEAGFEDEGQGDGHAVAEGDADVAHVAYLLGNEGAVGEVLLMGRAVGVDGEGDAHLAGGDAGPLGQAEAGVGVEHLDAAFVGEVDFGFVGDDGQDVAGGADAGVAHLEAAGGHIGLVLVLGADGAVDVGHIAVAGGGLLGAGGQWQQGEQGEQDVLLHFSCCLVSGGKGRKGVLYWRVIFISFRLRNGGSFAYLCGVGDYDVHLRTGIFQGNYDECGQTGFSGHERGH